MLFIFYLLPPEDVIKRLATMDEQELRNTLLDYVRDYLDDTDESDGDEAEPLLPDDNRDEAVSYLERCFKMQ